jgi:hypothetical protein
MDVSTLSTLICIKLVMILLVPCDNGIDQLVKIMFEWICVPCVEWYGWR